MRTLLALLVAALVVGGTVWAVAGDALPGSVAPRADGADAGDPAPERPADDGGAADRGDATGGTDAGDDAGAGGETPAPAPPEPFRPADRPDDESAAGGGSGGSSVDDAPGTDAAGDDAPGDDVPSNGDGGSDGDGVDAPTTPPGSDPSDGTDPVEPPSPSAPPAPPVPSAPSVPDPGASPETTRDVLGWEDGYRYDAAIDVDQSDGLSEAELDALVARTAARIELLRGLEFVEPVTVEVISREEHRRQGLGANASADPDPLNEQVWEALFVVDEGTTVNEAFATLYGSNVLGYYSPSEKRLVLISVDADRTVVDPHTLAHELVHALQDQHYDLGASAASVRTQDAQLARNGLIEGEANYLAALYVERCATEWDCLERPDAGDPGSDRDVNLPLLLIVFQPYSDGPVYVDSLVASGGWAAVNAAHASLPATTEQVITPGVTDPPVAVPLPEVARNGWARVGDPAGDTLGEASIYVMFWNQAAENRVDVLDDRAFLDPDGDPRFDVYDYSAPVSDGWAGDRLVAYERNGSYGYVWATEWDTPGDAAEFAAAYRAVLVEGYDAEVVGPDTYVVERGPYADAFHVTLDGSRVVVVNAPTAADLPDVHSPARAAATAPGRTGAAP